MSTKVFKTRVEFQKHIESICEKAIEETAMTAKEKLFESIESQYYNDSEFYPNLYERTYEFLNSATYHLLSSDKAEIYIDIDGMHYGNNFSPWQVVSWASESKHGADYLQTNTPDLWTIFIEWCNSNLIKLLKENLKKYGLNII